MIEKKISLQELVTKYEGCGEEEYVKMVATTIAEMGIPNRHWEDLMQQILFHILQKKHHPIEGMRENTILYTRIRSRIIDFLRKEKRRQLKSFSVSDDQLEYTVDILRLSGEDTHDTLARAVNAAVAQLSDDHQRICRLLMQGYNLFNTAKILGIYRRKLRKEINSIRCILVSKGIEEIIAWREGKRL